MAKKTTRARPNPAAGADYARLAELDAFLLATEGLTPQDVDRINAEWGLPVGQAPTDIGIDSDRLAASGRARGAVAEDVPAPFAGGGLREWADSSATPAASSITPPGNTYEVLAIGDSMVGAGILDRDRLQVRAASAAADGDIVVARVAGSGWLLRRLDSIGGATVLRSENPNVLAVAFDEYTPAEIFGVVIGWAKATPSPNPKARQPGKKGRPMPKGGRPRNR